MIWVLGSKEKYLRYEDMHDDGNDIDNFFHYDPAWAGGTFDDISDVVFLEEWYLDYRNVSNLLEMILRLMNAENANLKTKEKIEFAIDCLKGVKESEKIFSKHDSEVVIKKKQLFWKGIGTLIKRIYKIFFLISLVIFFLSFFIAVFMGIFFNNIYPFKDYISRLLTISGGSIICIVLLLAASYLKDGFGFLVKWVKEE